MTKTLFSSASVTKSLILIHSNLHGTIGSSPANPLIIKAGASYYKIGVTHANAHAMVIHSPVDYALTTDLNFEKGANYVDITDPANPVLIN